jgi:hypothetical protein
MPDILYRHFTLVSVIRLMDSFQWTLYDVVRLLLPMYHGSLVVDSQLVGQGVAG